MDKFNQIYEVAFYDVLDKDFVFPAYILLSKEEADSVLKSDGRQLFKSINDYQIRTINITYDMMWLVPEYYNVVPNMKLIKNINTLDDFLEFCEDKNIRYKDFIDENDNLLIGGDRDTLLDKDLIICDTEEYVKDKELTKENENDKKY